jgi:hypothetical protein
MVFSVVEITEPIGIEIVGDRLHATFTSGSTSWRFAVTFNKARLAAVGAQFMLDEHEAANVVEFRPKKRRRPHG